MNVIYHLSKVKIDLLHESEITQSDEFINFKIIIVGDSGVGKSSLLKRAVQNKFDGNYAATIGFEFLLMHFRVKVTDMGYLWPRNVSFFNSRIL